MCFSETASFVAGSGLVAVGIGTVIAARHTSHLALAFVPILFGIQQIAEGFVWRDINSHKLVQGTLPASATFYMFMAYVFWPIFLPFAVRLAESKKLRRAILSSIQAIGIAVGAYGFSGITNHSVDIHKVGGHVDYAYQIPFELTLTLTYYAVVVLATLISSSKTIRVFGGFIAIGAPIASWITDHSMESVWCFFTAMASAIVLAHVIQERSQAKI